jgi:lipoprotein signal peptidase
VDFFDVDFFTIDLFGYHLSRFWVFNVADASVTIGVLLLMLFHRVAVSGDKPVHPSTSTEPPVAS